jgi:hypothetical protein
VNELAGRGVLAGVVLVLAAVVVTMSGGAGLGGRLGALFGLHSGQAGKPVAAAHAAAPALPESAVTSVRVFPRAVAPRKSQPKSRTRPRTAPAPGRAPVAGEAPRPAPAQPPVAPPPPTVPKPAPTPQGNVERTVQTVRETVAPVTPQPAQPVLDQTTQTVGQVCALIGGCP